MTSLRQFISALQLSQSALHVHVMAACVYIYLHVTLLCLNHGLDRLFSGCSSSLVSR